MEMIYKDFEIAGLIARFIAGQATPEEAAALEEWKRQSAGNAALYDRLTSAENMRELEKMSRRYEKAEGWKKVRDRMDVPARKRRRRPLRIAVAVVAAAVVAAVIAVPLLMDRAGETEMAADIIPGGFKARLVLPDGSEVALDGSDAGKIVEQSGVVLSDATLDYGQGDPETAMTGHHLLDVPKGGECRVRLADGTVVYINSMTTLRYPIAFSGDTRCVELSGEAYFEVAHGDKPFIVRTAGMDVRVHGTSFNVTAYDDDATVRATLVSGSVAVSSEGGDEVVLRPSEQAEFDRDSRTVTVREVDTILYTSWKDGQLRFKDVGLGEIMHTLARWYDIEEVYYESEAIRDMRFGLNLDRYNQITPILDLLNRTGVVSARIEGKRIIFSH